jgi:hypothetical protein
MIYRLTRLAAHQTARVVGLVYFIVALILAPLFYLVSRANPTEALPVWIIVAGPILYGALAYVFTAVGCVLYNVVAGRVGGIEFTLDERAPVASQQLT